MLHRQLELCDGCFLQKHMKEGFWVRTKLKKNTKLLLTLLLFCEMNVKFFWVIIEKKMVFFLALPRLYSIDWTENDVFYENRKLTSNTGSKSTLPPSSPSLSLFLSKSAEGKRQDGISANTVWLAAMQRPGRPRLDESDRRRSQNLYNTLWHHTVVISIYIVYSTTTWTETEIGLNSQPIREFLLKERRK